MTYAPISTFNRKKLDFYPTPECCRKTIEKIFIDKYKNMSDILVWDNAFGTGVIGDALSNIGFDVVSSDIQKLADNLDQEIDFYNCTKPPKIDNYSKKKKLVICTNPPYGRKLSDWIRHSQKLIECLINDKSNDIESGEIWYLLRHTFNTGSKRMDLQKSIIENHVMCWRPVWEVGTKGGGMHNSTWFMFGINQVPYSKTIYHEKP